MPCIYHKSGCLWNGNITELKHHLETCEFGLLDCPQKCGKKIGNDSVEEHLKVFCLSTPKICRHCGTSTTRGTQEDHSRICLRFPVPCPNDCSVGCVPRGEIEIHLKNECERVVAACSFKHLGCRYEGSQLSVHEHMEGFVKEHLLLVSGVVAEQAIENKKQQIRIQKLTNEKDVLEKKVNQLVDQLTLLEENKEQELKTIKETTTQVQNKVDELEKKNVEINETIGCLCYTWKITDFPNKMKMAEDKKNQKLESPTFYSHLNGYRLQGKIFLNEESKNSEKHIGLFISLLKGDHDEALIWPFEFNIQFTIKDQNSDTNKAVHKELTLDTAESEANRSYFKAPHTDGVSYGFSFFLSHEALYNQTFIKDDTLIIQYTFIKK